MTSTPIRGSPIRCLGGVRSVIKLLKSKTKGVPERAALSLHFGTESQLADGQQFCKDFVHLSKKTWQELGHLILGENEIVVCNLVRALRNVLQTIVADNYDGGDDDCLNSLCSVLIETNWFECICLKFILEVSQSEGEMELANDLAEVTCMLVVSNKQCYTEAHGLGVLESILRMLSVGNSETRERAAAVMLKISEEYHGPSETLLENDGEGILQLMSIIQLDTVGSIDTQTTTSTLCSLCLKIIAVCIMKSIEVYTKLHSFGFLPILIQSLRSTTIKSQEYACLILGNILHQITKDSHLEMKALKEIFSSGSLVELCWLLLHSSSFVANQAQRFLQQCSKVSNPRNTAQVFIEQGCVPILHIVRSSKIPVSMKNFVNSYLRWIAANSDGDSMAMYLAILKQDVNVSLKRNIIVALLILSSLNENIQRKVVVSVDDFVESISVYSCVDLFQQVVSIVFHLVQTKSLPKRIKNHVAAISHTLNTINEIAIKSSEGDTIHLSRTNLPLAEGLFVDNPSGTGDQHCISMESFSRKEVLLVLEVLSLRSLDAVCDALKRYDNGFLTRVLHFSKKYSLNLLLNGAEQCLVERVNERSLEDLLDCANALQRPRLLWKCLELLSDEKSLHVFIRYDRRNHLVAESCLKLCFLTLCRTQNVTKAEQDHTRVLATVVN